MADTTDGSDVDGVIRINYPVYLFTGGNFNYPNEEMDTTLTGLEMIDIEITSSDDEVSLSEYDLVKIDEYEIENKNTVNKTAAPVSGKEIAHNNNCVSVSGNANASEYNQSSPLKQADKSLLEVYASLLNEKQLRRPRKSAREFDRIIALRKPKLECVVCKSLHSNLTKIKKHFRREHPLDEYHIECCKLRITGRAQIEEHLRSRHSADQLTNSEPTSIHNEQLEAFIHHYIPSLKCSHCSEERPSFGSLKEHFRIRHPNEVCSIVCCRRKLTRAFAIVEHIRVHIDINTFKCGLCEKLHITTLGLERHMHAQHNLLWATSIKYNNADTMGKNKSIARIRFEDLDLFIAQWKEKLVCMVCFKSFLSFAPLKSHFCENHPIDECYVLCCGHKLKNRHQIEEHIHVHTNQMGFKCQLCTNAYFNRSTLYSHMVTKHPVVINDYQNLQTESKLAETVSVNSKPANKIDELVAQCKVEVKCGECSKKCKTVTLLKRHFKYEHPYQEFYFLCCQKKLKHYYSISYHLRRHANQSTPSPKDEVIIPDGVPDRISGRRQKITHKELDELVARWKPNLKCALCPKTCPTFSQLKIHFRDSHPRTECYILCCKLTLRNAFLIEEHIRFHNNPHAFSCEHCDKCCSTRNNLLNHMKNMHYN